ncbi:MoaF-related domain-containing protein [Mesorhizobium amorphae]
MYWSRRAGQHVVHVDDFKNGVAYTNIFLPDGTATRARGTLAEVK